MPDRRRRLRRGMWLQPQDSLRVRELSLVRCRKFQQRQTLQNSASVAESELAEDPALAALAGHQPGREADRARAITKQLADGFKTDFQVDPGKRENRF